MVTLSLANYYLGYSVMYLISIISLESTFR